MFRGNFLDDDEAMYQAAMMRRGGQLRRFDEYFRCYPIVMMPGPDRDEADHGGKVFLPPSALDKLTRLHITYPMLFELINTKTKKQTHAGVLEFVAEEGKIHLPKWLMDTLNLESGDLLQVRSTDLPLGTFIKLQPQSTAFLDISDPKAVLENAFRNFSCLTTGDVFTFKYNGEVYRVAVLETKPESAQKAICTLETDLSVDFAPPVGYEESKRTSGTSTPRSASSAVPAGLAAKGGMLHSHGTMAQAINYPSIAPQAATTATTSTSTSASTSASAQASANFVGVGNRLASAKKAGKAPVRSATPDVVAATGAMPPPPPPRRANGPQPLRIGPNKLFFGYEVKPVPKKTGKEEEKEEEQSEHKEPVHFQGQGQTLRKKKGDGKGDGR